MWWFDIIIEFRGLCGGIVRDNGGWWKIFLHIHWVVFIGGKQSWNKTGVNRKIYQQENSRRVGSIGFLCSYPRVCARLISSIRVPLFHYNKCSLSGRGISVVNKSSELFVWNGEKQFWGRSKSTRQFLLFVTDTQLYRPNGDIKQSW